MNNGTHKNSICLQDLTTSDIIKILIVSVGLLISLGAWNNRASTALESYPKFKEETKNEFKNIRDDVNSLKIEGAELKANQKMMIGILKRIEDRIDKI